MYALNTFLRLTRFIANTAIGLAVGFGMGILFADGKLGDIVRGFY